MRPNSDWDSLDMVELAMDLEEKGVVLDEEIDLTELSSAEGALLLEIACPPYHARWLAPEPEEGWPSTVRVLGERDRTVLFAVDEYEGFGVGCAGTNGVIDDARIYPSLRRALFAVTRQLC